MLLNKVVVGKGYKLMAANTTLTEPPAGHDSVSVVICWFFDGVLTRKQVLAEVGTGLNYHGSIRPSYLVTCDKS